MAAGSNGGLMVRDARSRAPHHEGPALGYSNSARFALVETVFGTEVAGGATSRLASGGGVSLASISAATGATFISPSRARVSAVRPGFEATGVNSAAWLAPTRTPEYATSPSVVATTSPGRSEVSRVSSTGANPAGSRPLQVQSARSALR